MAIFFKTAITDATAFEMLEELLSSGQGFDGYFNQYGEEDELTLSWAPAMSADEFKDEVTDAFRTLWQTTRFWLVYQRNESRDDLSINEIRSAAIRLSRSYAHAVVVTFCLLGRADSNSDLELIFVCFRDEAERRNFRVRYEGKFIPAS